MWGDMRSMYVKYWKRLMDVVLSFLGIMVLAVPMLIIAIAVKLDTPGPVLFKQRRIGIHKKEFQILKFRTMRTDAPSEMPTHLLNVEAVRFTRLQKLLRKTSLDELPQLFCIFVGSMSIIGPRPALWNQYDLLAERDKYSANDVKPGLTGWAQINGRDTITIEDKARYDGEYVRRMSFGFDVKCFFGTIVSVLRRDGVQEGGIPGLRRDEREKEVVGK